MTAEGTSGRAHQSPTQSHRAKKNAAQREQLRQAAEKMHAEGKGEQAFEMLFDVIESLQNDNERLTYKVAAATRARFGRQSEKLTAEQLGQLVLALGGTEAQAAEQDPNLPAPAAPTEKGPQPKGNKSKKRRRKHPGRTRLSPDLPRRVTEKSVPEGEQACLRCGEQMPLLDQLDEWVDDNLPKLRPTSPLASAASYAKAQRPFIRRCFSDGRFEIYNGRVERQIREPALGRKNYLFTGSADAARRLAIAYTVVLWARHVGLPVRDYLIDIMGCLANGHPARRLGELLPIRWGVDKGLLAAEQSPQ